MAPKRKARLPSRAASTPSAEPSDLPASEIATPSKVVTGEETSDAWTDEQETSLLQSIIRWKPVGMHKHFRMIAISESLRSHGHTSPTDDRTRPAGIWKKLEDLYNLDALDQREDGFGYPSTNDVTQELFVDFDLPDEEYWDMMFARRVAPAGTSSPPTLSFQTLGGSAAHADRRHSTVDDSEDPRSSPASMKGQRGGRGGRSRPSKLAKSSRSGRQGRVHRSSVDSNDGGGENDEDSMDVGGETGKTRRSGRRR